ncbi:helix-turn-helix transcriptional regulator [Halorarius litoreus]|uniref:helix-turn-helix transcriptional regulator n=1 Tax=Halorarius litoreus TaxID=2962676 RepID=UPI0020CB96E4|nr:hypothetical protein [Halorarius litoreus]
MFRKLYIRLSDSLGDETVRDATERGTQSAGAPADRNRGTDEVRTRSELLTETGYEPDTYVEKLLASNDGRLRQCSICDATRLSASTTSRLLSEMEADGQVVRITTGREKVVCLPEHAPDIDRRAST